MKCTNCGQSKMTARQEARRYADLPGVTVVATVRHCEACGEELVGYRNIEGLNRAIARALAFKHSRLLPAEIRFLRTYLGLASKDLAKTLRVAEETVSRWENGHSLMEVTTELLLRLLVRNGRPVAKYEPESVDVIAALPELAQGKPAIERQRATQHGEQWEVAAA